MMDRDSSALSTARFAGCLPVVPLLQTLMVGSNTPHSTPLHGVHSAQHNKIAFNNQHAHNYLLQSVKVPLPLLPAGCKAAAGIYGSLQTSCPTFFFRFHLSERASERASERFEVALTSSVSSVTLGSVVACT
jgi:hypothetical protein